MLGISSVCFLFFCMLASGNSDVTLSGKQGPFCSPARCTDGTCYCSESNLGWWNGGAAQAFGNSNCYRAGRGDCQCKSCGQASTQCLDYRCNDLGTEDSAGICYDINADGTKTRNNGDYATYDYCYLKNNPCEDCENHGWHKVGCARTNPGTCLPCVESLAAGKFWRARGSCDQVTCTIPDPGRFVVTACKRDSDAVIGDCSKYSKNLNSIGYYCPGKGVLDPLPLPSNSRANAGFTNFICNEGYFRDGDRCVACPAGSCCVGEGLYSCPEHYYSSGKGNIQCTQCTLACLSDKEKLMRKCAKNSIQTPTACISCGLCGKWPETGYNCVTNPQDFSYLPSTCCGSTCLN